MKFYLNNERFVNPTYKDVKIVKQLDDDREIMRYVVSGSFTFFGADYDYIKTLTSTKRYVDFYINYGQTDETIPELLTKLDLSGDYDRNKVKLKCTVYDLYNDVSLKENDSRTIFYSTTGTGKAFYVRVLSLGGDYYYFRSLKLQNIIQSLFQAVLGSRSATIDFNNYSEKNFATLFLAATADINIDNEPLELSRYSRFEFKTVMDFLAQKFGLYYKILNAETQGQTEVLIDFRHISEITETILTNTKRINTWDGSFKHSIEKILSLIKRECNDGETPSKFKGMDIKYPNIYDSNVKNVSFNDFYSNIQNIIANRDDYPNDNETFVVMSGDVIRENAVLETDFEWDAGGLSGYDGSLALETFRGTATRNADNFNLKNTGLNPHTGFYIQTNYSSFAANEVVTIEFEYDVFVASAYNILSLHFYLFKTSTGSRLNGDDISFIDLQGCTWNNDVGAFELITNHTGFRTVKITIALKTSDTVGIAFRIMNYNGDETGRTGFSALELNMKDFLITMEPLYRMNRTGESVLNYRCSQSYCDEQNYLYMEHSDTTVNVNGTDRTVEVGKLQDIDLELVQSIDFDEVNENTIYSGDNRLEGAKITRVEKALGMNKTKVKLMK